MSKPIPPRPGASAVRARLAEILRVDHAGELGAVHIYQGQRAVLGAHPDGLRRQDRVASELTLLLLLLPGRLPTPSLPPIPLGRPAQARLVRVR